MARRPFPYPPRQSSGFWSVRLPPSARVGEVRVFIGSTLPPPDGWNDGQVAPPQTRATCAMTLVVPGMWINGGMVDIPPGGTGFTFKVIARAKNYTWPASNELSTVNPGAVFCQADRSPYDGTYTTLSFGPPHYTARYWGPGSTTNDGTALPADACAFYVTPTVGPVDGWRIGPPSIQNPSGTNATYVGTNRPGGANVANIEVCSIGATTGSDGTTFVWDYIQRVDALATHTTPLLPHLLPP